MSLSDFTPNERFLMSKPIHKKNTKYINFRDRLNKGSRVRLCHDGPVLEVTDGYVRLGETRESERSLTALRDFVLRTAALNSKRWFGREFDVDSIDSHTDAIDASFEVDKLSEFWLDEEQVDSHTFREEVSCGTHGSSAFFLISGIRIEKSSLHIVLTLDRIVALEKDINAFEVDEGASFPECEDIEGDDEEVADEPQDERVDDDDFFMCVTK